MVGLKLSMSFKSYHEKKELFYNKSAEPEFDNIVNNRTLN